MWGGPHNHGDVGNCAEVPQEPRIDPVQLFQVDRDLIAYAQVAHDLGGTCRGAVGDRIEFEPRKAVTCARDSHEGRVRSCGAAPKI